ncbi:uncharacterized protein EV420DRAFT_1765385 [Desarmillaria tabescens]|uniref:HNH nuclease domain-containing protein n=1 Tax=Armillaria tabescens TaxID=1929756 RepID=A0AA39N376_ARMTA|nr:uncharacterized protein EV420DRAFT_1765385 [Desarmillaria tabescens]KAK0455734.1 hypothetical protein EV420DRAFT_1765385 [Desarmillaria tabescens]
MSNEGTCTEFATELWTTLTDSFRQSVTEKIESSTPTFSLVALAETKVSCLERGFVSGDISLDIYRPSTVHEDIDPEAVLSAMLIHATDDDTCTAPRRYVACAIVTAATQDEQLIELANIWVRYLFWPFKADECRCREPSIKETRTSAASRSHFEDAVKQRDDNRCVVTRVQDMSVNPDVMTITEPTHILKRVAGAGKRSETSSAEYATWDILRHFAALSEDEVNELDANINCVRNGITLDLCLHTFFDNFCWTLRPDASIPTSVYKRNIKAVNFEEYPAELRPSRKLIQFHYSLSKILHASGAFWVIVSMMKRFFPEDCVPAKFDCLNADDLLFYLNAEKMLQQVSIAGDDIIKGD